MTSMSGCPLLSIFWPCRTLAMTCSGVCLRAMIREFPPVSILGHETHINTGLLSGDPTRSETLTTNITVPRRVLAGV